MDEPTIKALLTLDITIVEGEKVLVIPYESLLRGNISVKINQPVLPTNLKVVSPPVATSIVEDDPISIPIEIQTLYSENAREKMAQDVVDYLKAIAKAWEFRNAGFQPSILKKAAKSKPALNSVIFQMYGKEGDVYLTNLVTDNMTFIRKYWELTTNAISKK